MSKNNHLGKVKAGKDVIALNIIAYTFCTIMALVCLVPFIMVLSGSFSSESAITANGFSLLPQEFSLEAYKTVFRDPMTVVRAYATTIVLTIVGTFLGLMIQTMTAYVLSRKDFEWRNFFSFFFYFTTLFSGGLVPTYILYTQTLDLQDSYLALLLPLLFSVYNLLIMKSYISAIPDSLVDAAKIDGCGEVRTLFQVIMPLIKPALATVGLFIALAYWNDWYNGMIYITESELFSIQQLLNRMLSDIQFLQSNSSMAGAADYISKIPGTTVRMSIAVVGILPILVIYPFMQNNFVKGIAIGAVKG